jgi:hypothetical protein
MSVSSESAPREMFLRLYREYFDHWNAERFWEAHESLEELWRETGDQNRLFLQGLIQATGAFHHIKNARRRPALVLFCQSLSYLGAYEPHGTWEGLHLPDFCGTLREWRGLVEARPVEGFSAEGFPAYPKANLLADYLDSANRGN